MKSCLLSLPSEIIEHIIHLSSIKPYDEADFLGWCYPEHNYVHLKYIALSCQRLYKLCAPFLWKHKEFILPREYDVKKGEAIQMATDLLSTPTALSSNFVLGDHICSLYRNLTTGPHFDLVNSSLMAQLVPNLRALRIDFHPSPRTEHYGLRYFFKYCPHLKELFISHCQDTFDDFAAIYQYKPKLISLALVDCTIKEDTLKVIIELLHPNLRRFLFRQVLIEPKARVKTNITHLLAVSHLDFLHPFHFQNSRAPPVPSRRPPLSPSPVNTLPLPLLPLAPPLSLAGLPLSKKMVPTGGPHIFISLHLHVGPTYFFILMTWMPRQQKHVSILSWDLN